MARLAAGQGGYVARRQLLALGVGASAVEHRRRSGRLVPHSELRGVYSVGHDGPGPRSRCWAAHLAVGPRSWMFARSAADLHDLRPWNGRPELVVLVRPPRLPGVVVRRTRDLPAADRTVVHGLPVTGVARTLLDLGAVLPHRAVEKAFDRAEVLGVLDHAAVARLLAAARGRPGAAVLRAIAERGRAGSTATESRIEEGLLAIVRAAGLPEPVAQMQVLRFRPDLCWPTLRLIVEADGGAVHRTRSAIEHDRERDVLLQNAGWTVLRFTRRQIEERPAYCARQIAAAHARLAPRPR